MARYANHFSSLLGSPKIPFCRVQFLSSRTSRMRLIFCSTQPTSRKSMLLKYRASAAHHCELPGLGPFSCSRSFVRRTTFGISKFGLKCQKRSFFGPLPLRHWCTNPCCSTAAKIVFLKRVARNANHFSSLLGSPKIPFCRVQFLSSRTSRMRLIFCSHSSNFPKIHAAIVQTSAAHHCELPGLGTVFPALVRSSVEPFFGISNFGQKRQNAPFWGRCCSATGAPIHAVLLLPSLSS